MLENEIYMLSSLMIIVVTLLVILLTYLLVRKARDNRRRNKIDMYKGKYRLPVYEYLITGTSTRLLQTSSKERETAIEELLSDFSNVLEGEETKAKLSHYAELHLGTIYRGYLQSKQWSKRMNTLFFIEDFHMRELEQDVENLLREKKATKEEVVQILCILASFQSPSIYKYLTDRFQHLLEFDYRNILKRLDADQLEPLVDRFFTYQPNLQYAILEIIGITNEVKYISFLTSIYQSCSGEIKMRAIKAIVNIGYIEDVKIFIPLCDSNVWQERMIVAKLLGITKDQHTVFYLKKLIHDQSWWVRSQAGESIARLPDGKEILSSIIKTSDDPYAKDMAGQWLSKGAFL